MTKQISVSPDKEAIISSLVDHYVANIPLYRKFLGALNTHISDAIYLEKENPLSTLVHSVKYRLKDPEHFRDKLRRKMIDCEQKQIEFPYTEENLFEKIGDLGGYRILHLHTRQFGEIHQRLVPVLEVAHKIIEGPEAKTWDEETKAYYESIGVETKHNRRLYSSVHYLVRPGTTIPMTMEIQVRTLADEIWGEIDHKINYPHPHESVACREQILALGRVTSSCSRLVDAIMTSHDDWESREGAQAAKLLESVPPTA